MKRSILAVVGSLTVAAGLAGGSLDTLAFDDTQYRAVTVDRANCLWCDLSAADLTDAVLAEPTSPAQT